VKVCWSVVMTLGRLGAVEFGPHRTGDLIGGGITNVQENRWEKEPPRPSVVSDLGFNLKMVRLVVPADR